MVSGRPRGRRPAFPGAHRPPALAPPAPTPLSAPPPGHPPADRRVPSHQPGCGVPTRPRRRPCCWGRPSRGSALPAAAAREWGGKVGEAGSATGQGAGVWGQGRGAAVGAAGPPALTPAGADGVPPPPAGRATQRARPRHAHTAGVHTPAIPATPTRAPTTRSSGWCRAHWRPQAPSWSAGPAARCGACAAAAAAQIPGDACALRRRRWRPRRRRRRPKLPRPARAAAAAAATAGAAGAGPVA